jgi:hypothetical protein
VLEGGLVTDVDGDEILDMAAVSFEPVRAAS